MNSSQSLLNLQKKNLIRSSSLLKRGLSSRGKGIKGCGMNTAFTISIVKKKISNLIASFPSRRLTHTLPPSHSYLPSTCPLPSSITPSLPLSHTPSLSPSLSDGSEDSLKALIHARQQSRGAQMDNFFDSLEQKYAKKQKSSSKAGGSKNKTSGGKGTRKGKKT